MLVMPMYREPGDALRFFDRTPGVGDRGERSRLAHREAVRADAAYRLATLPHSRVLQDSLTLTCPPCLAWFLAIVGRAIRLNIHLDYNRCGNDSHVCSPKARRTITRATFGPRVRASAALEGVPPATLCSGSCQRRTVVSKLPEMARRPSGENATEFTAMVCPSIRHTSLPLARSHKWTGPSRPADKARRLSGENATHLTCLSSLFNCLSSFPVATSHKRTVSSLPAERMSRPSAEQARLRTRPTCPVNVCNFLPVLQVPELNQPCSPPGDQMLSIGTESRFARELILRDRTSNESDWSLFLF